MAGCGMMQMPTWIVGDELKRGMRVPLLRRRISM